MTLCIISLVLGFSTVGIADDGAVDPVPEIIETATHDEFAWDWLATLCDRYGPRLSGSEAFDRAAAWAEASLVEAGFDRVWTEPVMVPHWVRGMEWA